MSSVIGPDAKRTGGRRPLSLTARLAMLFALLAAGLLLLVGLLLERSIAAHFEELDEHDLNAKTATIAAMIAQVDGAQAFDELPQRLRDVLAGHENIAVLLRNAAGDVVFSQRPASFGADRRAAEAGLEAAATWEQGGRRFIGVSREYRMPWPDAQGLHALVALDISHHAHFLTDLRNRLWIGISIAAAVAALLGWFVATRGLAPLARVTAAARRLSAERLGERIDEHEAPAELRELTEAFNGMLDRLQTAFGRLSDFSSDLAHELRTPISNLMTETQVALSRSRSEEDYRNVLVSNLEEFERIARMVSDMLFLARADNGLLPRPAETVELADEAAALLEFYEALAAEQGVRLTLNGRAMVLGDRLMLRRALSNLISNALRHTSSGQEVRVDIGTDSGGVRLAVSNPGERIPADQLSRLFERFHRIDAARSRPREHGGEGAGLGLAIALSIAEAHGGRIEVQSDDVATVFALRLPSLRARVT